jgi:predicted transcriptional regulator
VGLSRMEKYLAIVKVLEDWNAITQQQIMTKAELNLASPKEYINFLVKLNLIKEKTHRNRTVYSVTPKGHRLCTHFRLTNDLSIFAKTRIIRID